MASLLKCASDSTTDVSSEENELFRNISTKKDTMRKKNINASSLKQDFKNPRHTFWVHRNRITMQQKLFQNLIIPKEAGASRNNIEMESQSHAQNWENMYILNIHRAYLLCPQSKASGSFFANMYWFCRKTTQSFSLWR